MWSLYTICGRTHGGLGFQFQIPVDRIVTKQAEKVCDEREVRAPCRLEGMCNHSRAHVAANQAEDAEECAKCDDEQHAAQSLIAV